MPSWSFAPCLLLAEPDLPTYRKPRFQALRCAGLASLSIRLLSGWRRSTNGVVEFPPMRRILAIVGSAIFLVIAPGTVVGYVPWRICHWHVEAPLAGIFSFRILGVLVIAAGLGTPAPIFPTRHLVVSGLYRSHDVANICRTASSFSLFIETSKLDLHLPSVL